MYLIDDNKIKRSVRNEEREINVMWKSKERFHEKGEVE